MASNYGFYYYVLLTFPWELLLIKIKYANQDGILLIGKKDISTQVIDVFPQITVEH